MSKPHTCQADKCSQGRAACPVPQACEVPDATDAGHAGAPAGGGTYRLISLMLATIAAAVVVINMASGA